VIDRGERVAHTMNGDPSELGTPDEVAKFLPPKVRELAHADVPDVYAYLDANTMQRTGDPHPRGSGDACQRQESEPARGQLPHYLVARKQPA
jgi:hypothetical protein